MNALITYEGFHGLGRRDVRRVHVDMAACMQVCGFAAEPSDSLLVLDQRDDDDAALRAAYEELKRDYGPYPRVLGGTNVTDRRALQTCLWQIPPGGVDAAFERAAHLRARGGLVQRRAFLKLICKFRFRDPDTRELLPGQDTLPRLHNWPGGHGDSSSVVLNLGHSSSVSLWFMFPFAATDEAFMSYAGRLQTSMPARLSPRGWRRWTPSRAGGWKAKKVNVNLQGHDTTVPKPHDSKNRIV
ncbi:MAG: hypothetical protein HY824_02045 [Acidobacteria bacterium]|nr:hypothetical protein [Acidobacteriota bacterium]